MGNEVESLKQHAHFIEVVSFIHTHTLPFLLCRLWPFDGDTCDRLFRHPEIVSVRSVYGNADRNAFFSEQAPFYPLFCAVSRIWPSFFPRKRCFPHRSIRGTEAPVNALQFVVFPKALLPELFEYSCLVPFLESAVS